MHCCIYDAPGLSIKSVDIASMWPGSTMRRGPSCSMKGHDFTSSASKNTARGSRILRTWFTVPLRWNKGYGVYLGVQNNVGRTLQGHACNLGAGGSGPAVRSVVNWRFKDEHALDALGTPAISIPMPVAKGLPLDLELTADHGQDARVIRTGR